MSEAEKHLRAALQGGLEVMRIDASPATQERLLAYLALLRKWNAVYNLTAIRDERDMVRQHLLDSLSILPVLADKDVAGQRWADIGSGAGLPGIPLAIVRPDLSMTLVESVTKKSAFQRQVRIELKIDNLEVFEVRVETVASGSFDRVVSRAFAELRDFVRLAGHLPRREGRLLAMKGVLNDEELSGLPNGWIVAECVPLQVPGLDARRHLVVLERSS